MSARGNQDNVDAMYILEALRNVTDPITIPVGELAILWNEKAGTVKERFRLIKKRQNLNIRTTTRGIPPAGTSPMRPPPSGPLPVGTANDNRLPQGRKRRAEALDEEKQVKVEAIKKPDLGRSPSKPSIKPTVKKLDWDSTYLDEITENNSPIASSPTKRSRMLVDDEDFEAGSYLYLR